MTSNKLFKIKLPFWWACTITMIIAPFLLLLVGGGLWLYEHGKLQQWLLFATGLTGGGWLIAAYLNHRNVPSLKATSPILHEIWNKESDPVAQKISAIKEAINPAEYSFDEPKKLLPLGFEVVNTVAATFYQDEKDPMLEVPIPYLLKIAELICKDTREMLNYIPGAHIITVNDLFQSQKLFRHITRFYTLYRIGTMILNPSSAIIRETRSSIQNKALEGPLTQLKLILLQAYVDRIAKYAIDLYSGTLSLEDDNLKSYITKASQRDLKNLTESPNGEPLRILILGQRNAGKSSLINALFGEMRAAVDILPVTTGITPYELERDGQRLLLLDTAGYQDVSDKNDIKRIENEILKCDFIFLTCAANIAARQPDKQLLESLNNCFTQNPNNPRPPLLIVLSHIDQLRPFREWEPPYDFVNPERPKEKSICLAAESVAQTLNLPDSDIIPVCLMPDAAYNINETLVPAMLARMSDASRVKCLRVLRERHNAERWPLFFKQIKNSGGDLLDLAGKVIK